jgi:pantothenate kinase
VPVVLTERNYLLAVEQPWTTLRDLLDEIWYLDTAREVRADRLIKRHRQFGKSDEQARACALGPDEVNAQIGRSTSRESPGRCDQLPSISNPTLRKYSSKPST